MGATICIRQGQTAEITHQINLGNLFHMSPYGLRIILCVRAHYITWPTLVGLGLI